jgi:polyferredoxin
MKKPILILCVVMCMLSSVASAEDFRFPMPEFETGYTLPDMHVPEPAQSLGMWDAAILFVFLCISTWLVLKKRSRRGIFVLTVVSLLYFGFWRKGCVCAIGSIQNVSLAIFDPTMGVSLSVLAIFLLPLLFALFFGRVYCAAICPLGAIQELVAIKPVEIPKSIEKVLSVIPYVYLGVAVLGVATGAGFLICRYDPYIGFFRLTGNFNMLVASGIFLLLGVFIGRPYCRILCPYGIMLGWMSRLSKWHAVIPPTNCVQCRLCEDSCPYNAINTPTPEVAPEARRQGVRRMTTLVILLPFIVALCAGTGYMMHDVLSRMNPKVSLANRVAEEELGFYSEMSFESEYFRNTKSSPAQLYEEALAADGDYKLGGALLGAFLGLIICFKLIKLSEIRKEEDYVPDKGACVSCGRCYTYCPVEEPNVELPGGVKI